MVEEFFEPSPPEIRGREGEFPENIILMYPVRCNCGKVFTTGIINTYRKLKNEGKSHIEAAIGAGLRRECCLMTLISPQQISERTIPGGVEIGRVQITACYPIKIPSIPGCRRAYYKIYHYPPIPPPTTVHLLLPQFVREISGRIDENRYGIDLPGGWKIKRRPARVIQLPKRGAMVSTTK
jgi:DNA-directed RNA polymerase subunit N (RpoN/RPB10)